MLLVHWTIISILKFFLYLNIFFHGGKWFLKGIYFIFLFTWGGLLYFGFLVLDLIYFLGGLWSWVFLAGFYLGGIWTHAGWWACTCISTIGILVSFKWVCYQYRVSGIITHFLVYLSSVTNQPSSPPLLWMAIGIYAISKNMTTYVTSMVPITNYYINIISSSFPLYIVLGTTIWQQLLCTLLLMTKKMKI